MAGVAYSRKLVPCRCTAKLQKARRIKKAKAASHAAWSSVKYDNGTDVIVKGTWHAD